MVKKFHGFMTALCIMMLMCTTSVLAADSTDTTDTTDTTTTVTDLAAYVEYYAQEYAQTYGAATAEELEYMVDNSVGVSKEFAESLYSYVENDLLGELLSMGDVTVTNVDDVYKAEVPLTYEKGNMTITFEMQYLLSNLRVTAADVSFSSSETTTLGDKLAKAGLNTVIGMCVNFVMLGAMCLIISQIKHVNKLAGLGKKKADTNTTEAAAAHATDSSDESYAADDDLELAAVITAAIAASEDAPSDGFTVRSIRRVRF